MQTGMERESGGGESAAALHAAIARLGDADAVRLLAAIARGQADGQRVALADARQVAATWRALNDAGPPTADAPGGGEGELARAALRWLAADPTQRLGLEALVTNGPPARFHVGAIGAFLALLLLLKTKGVLRYKDGKWYFKIELVELKAGPLKPVLDLFARLI